MSLWECPNCETDQINSIYEYYLVYNWSSTFHEEGYRIADEIIGNGIVREMKEDKTPSDNDHRPETDYEVCSRWVSQDRPEKMSDTDGPAYICSNCRNTYTSLEVPYND